MKLKKQNQGFSQLEVLITLIVLSIVLLPFMGGFNQSINTGMEAGFNTQAAYLSSGRLEFLTGLSFCEITQLIKTESAWEEIESNFYDDYYDMFKIYNYYEIIEENNEMDHVLVKIKVKITWKERERPKEYFLSNIVLLHQ